MPKSVHWPKVEVTHVISALRRKLAEMNAVHFLILKGSFPPSPFISVEGIQVIEKSITYAKCEA